MAGDYDTPMELRLIREPSVDGVTIGRLSVNGRFAVWTLEDEIRNGPKVLHQTAIPAGRYRVVITKSQRFGKMLPLLENVPGFAGVRIHSGNVAADTSGCILVGMQKGQSSVLQSRVAMDVIQPQIAAALAKGEDVWLTIENPSPERVLRA